MKSSVDAESVLEGRPDGGIGWICNKTNNVTYKGIDIDNNRISGIQIIVQGKSVTNILGVYFYHFIMDLQIKSNCMQKH